MTGLTGIADLLLLAQRSAWENLGNRFSGESLKWQREDTIGVLALLLVFVGGMWLLHWLSRWQTERGKRHSPARLFKELTAAHRLNYRQRRLCREVAKGLNLANSSEVFVQVEARGRIAKRDPDLAERLFS